jgi:hypothetical protein
VRFDARERDQERVAGAGLDAGDFVLGQPRHRILARVVDEPRIGDGEPARADGEQVSAVAGVDRLELRVVGVVVACDDGLAVGGVNVKVELKRLQWTSVRASEGEGFYNWESERKEVEAGEWTVTTEPEPSPLHIPIAEGGEYLLIATANDGKGRTTKTRIWFYAVGAGYTAWERYDHNRIDLIPEKKTWKPGDTARIMVKSPWETATALITTEREGVRTWTPFELTSTQTLLLGVSAAFGPNNSGPSARTEIYGADLYWKWKSARADKGFPFVSLQSEFLARRYGADERESIDEPGVTLPDAGDPSR